MKLKWLKDKLGEKFYPIAHATGVVVAENKTLDSKLDEIDAEIGNKANKTEMMDIKMLGWSVPKECPIHNEVNGNQFVQKVGRVDLGSYNYKYSSSDGFYVPNFDSSKYGIANNNKNYSIGYITCTNMDSLRQSTKGLFINGTSFNIKDTSYTDATTFKQAMQGHYLYYELATPITKTIDGNEIGEIVSDVRKETTVNLLNPTLQTTTSNGVTCTNNGDGTYTLKGTASDNTAISIQGIKVDKQKKYKLVGCPANGKDSTYHLVIVSLKTTNYSDYRYDYGDGIIVDNLQFEDYTINIDVVKGTTVNNLVFKPMLTTNLDATYDDFLPYTGDSGNLNGDVADLRSSIYFEKEISLAKAQLIRNGSYSDINIISSLFLFGANGKFGLSRGYISLSIPVSFSKKDEIYIKLPYKQYGYKQDNLLPYIYKTVFCTQGDFNGKIIGTCNLSYYSGSDDEGISLTIDINDNYSFTDDNISSAYVNLRF